MTVKRIAWAWVLWMAAAAPLTAQAKDGIEAQTQQILASVFASDSMATLEELTDRLGPRLTGTKEYEDSANWSVKQFHKNGIDRVHLEAFTIPSGWQRGPATGEITSPVHRALHLASVSWSPSTPLSGAQGEVMVVSDLSPAGLTASAAAIHGHIVLLDTDKAFAAGFDQSYGDLQAAYRTLHNLGVPLLLFPDAVPNNVLGDWLDLDNGEAKIQPLPIAEIGLEDSLLIQRLLLKGPVSLRAEYQNKITGPTVVHNVVAEIRGSEHPEEWVLVGAHLDSWDLATGAQDNGTGSVMVLETAKALAALPPPRRSMRFVLWTGEEPGLMGSRIYVKQHAAELGQCVAVLNTDNGVGHPRGWKVAGRKDLSDAMDSVERNYLQGLGATENSLEVTFDTDHGPFFLHGIPALDLWVDMGHYQEVHHKSSDTFDKVDALNFHADTAVVAVSAWVVANQKEAIAPHIGHSEVAAILKKANLVDYLIAHGDWTP